MEITERIDKLEARLQAERDSIEWERFENVLLHESTANEEMKLVAVVRDIERIQICRDFVKEFGEAIEISCSENFSLIIRPCLCERQVGVRAQFVLNPETENFLYNHVYDSHSDLRGWFNTLCRNMAFGFRGAPGLMHNLWMSDVKRVMLYYNGPRAEGLYRMIDEYLKTIAESRPGPVIDDDED